jgi:GPI inositol-deacylase, winged helix domain/Ankyrin repeats (3 copies)
MLGSDGLSCNLQLFQVRRQQFVPPKDATMKLDRLETQTGPPELDQVYEEIYQINTEPDSHSRTVADRCYQWVMAAQRPFQLSELTQAVSHDENGCPDNDITEELILIICSNFLLEDTSQAIQFCHVSAREFLGHRQTGLTNIRFSEQVIHSYAAICCLAFLQNNNPKNISSPEKQPASGIGFDNYARDFVMVHLNKSDQHRKQDPLSSMVQNFLWAASTTGESLFSRWVEAQREEAMLRRKRMHDNFTPVERLRDSCSNPPNPAFLACAWGFSEIFEDPSHSLDIGQVTTSGNNPVLIACKYGFHDLVVMLLQRSTCVAPNQESMMATALRLAAGNGHEQITRTLLEWQPSFDFEEDLMGLALIDAASRDHFSIFKLVFDLAKGQEGRSGALASAVKEGHNRKMIQMLLDGGADAGDMKLHGWLSPIQEAARHGMSDVVKMFLEYGTYAEPLGQHWSNPLKGCDSQENTDKQDFFRRTSIPGF